MVTRFADRSIGARNLATMVPGRLLTQLIGIVSVVVLARLMGASEYGRYAAVLAVIATCRFLTALGLPVVEIRFLAAAREAESQSLETLASSMFTLRSILSVLGGVLAAAWYASSNALSLDLALCLALGIVVVVQGVFEAARGLFLPIDRPATLISLDVLRAAATLTVVALAFSWGGLDLALFALLPMSLALAATALVLLRRQMRLRWTPTWWKHLRSKLRFGLSSMAGETSLLVTAQITIYAVAEWGSTASAGVVALALQAHLLLQGLLLTTQRALLPVWSRLAERQEIDRLESWFRASTMHLVALVTTGVLLFSAIGSILLEWTVGSEYRAAYFAGVLILTAGLLRSVTTLATGLLYARGRASQAASVDVAYGSSVIACLLLAFGTRGAGLEASEVGVIFLLGAFVSFGITLFLLARNGLTIGPSVLVLSLPIVLAVVLAREQAATPNFEPLLCLMCLAAAFLYWLLCRASGLSVTPRSLLRHFHDSVPRPEKAADEHPRRGQHALE